MKTRTFRGESVHGLIRQVRHELGDNVVILDTREIDNGALVEIDIGLLEDAEAAKTPSLVVPSEATLDRSADENRESDFGFALEANGICDELRAVCAPYLRGSVDSERLGKALAKAIPFRSKLPFDARVIAFVGPTGAGKTTTIAKLTAQLQHAFGLRIGLVAADSYRVGAEYHLGAFAKLLGVPLAELDDSVAPELQISEAVRRLDACDLVLIDTAGASPSDESRLDDLAEALGNVGESERILVLPAPGNEFDLQFVTRAYSIVAPTRAVITKVDESGYLGPVLNTVFKSKLPLAFVCSGQRVPEDIEPASPRRLGWMLMRRMH